jgi:3-isopropylmalate dehydrogenase
MASSGNIHPGKVSLFEPVHGSAPKYAGKNVTNPIGAILSAGLMLDYTGYPEAAKGIESAVIQTIAAKQVTRDLGGSLTTTAAGDAICLAMK